MNRVAETFGRLSKFVANSGDEQDTLYLIEGQEETIAVDNLELRTISFSSFFFFCHVYSGESFRLRQSRLKKKKKIREAN